MGFCGMLRKLLWHFFQFRIGTHSHVAGAVGGRERLSNETFPPGTAGGLRPFQPYNPIVFHSMENFFWFFPRYGK